MSWVDVTALSRQCADELRLQRAAPMLASPAFSLQESMAAVEIMDPKMDQCCGLSGKGLTHSDLFVFRSPDQLTEQELVALMQQMLCGFVAFLNGSSILDSCHKCSLLWADGFDALSRERSLWGRALFAFSGCLVKSVNHTFDCVLLADIYEDEDFCPSFRAFTTDWVCTEAEAEATIEALGPELAQFPSVHALLQLARDVMRMLVAQLSWTRRVVAAVRQPAAADRVVFAEESHIRSLLFAAKEVASKATLLQTTPELPVDGLADFFPPLLCRVRQIGPLKSPSSMTCSEQLAALSMIASQVAHIVTGLEALQAVAPLALDHVLEVCGVLASPCAPHRLHLLARSLLVSCLQCLTLRMDELLLESMLLRGLPSALVRDNALLPEWMAGNLRLAAWELLRVHTVCRSRMMARMENILMLWGHTVAEALYLDAQPPGQPWFSSWVCVHATAAMELQLRLLVEMDIVEPSEWDYFYWYWDYVNAAGAHAAKKLRALRFELDTALFEAEQQKAKAAKPKKKAAAPPSPPLPVATFAEELLARGRGQVAKGLFRVAILLKNRGLVEPKVYTFSAKADVFARRFAAFQHIMSPAPLSFSDFVNTVYSGNEEASVDTAALAASASVCFKNAKMCMDEARRQRFLANETLLGAFCCESGEALALAKVAVASSVELLRLQRHLAGAEAAGRATIHNQYHPHFPVASSPS